MMKMNFKKSGLLIIVTFALIWGDSVLAINPGNSNAGNVETNEETKNKGADKNLEIRNEIQSRFCEKIDGLASGLQNRITERKNNVLQKREERLAGLEENAAERDAKISERRILRDQNMEEHFQALAEKAQTKDQTDATEKFQEAVKSAIQVRRNAMDAAIESFRGGVAKLHEERKNYMEAEITEYRDTQEQAIATAKVACQNNESGISIRQNLKNSLKLAKNNFSAEKKNAEKIQTEMKILIQTRRQAIEKANADFKAAVNAAKAELKTAFSAETSDSQ